MQKEGSFMKILKIEERKAFYEKNEEYEPIAKLNGEDLLYLLEKIYILEDDSIFFDENIDEIASEPDRIVYEEILKQLKKFFSEKQSIQDELNNEFIDLDKMLK